MSFHKISRNIKIAAVCLYQDEILSLAAILNYLLMSQSTFYHLYALWLATEDVVHYRNDTL